jgi:hypothetical protein
LPLLPTSTETRCVKSQVDGILCIYHNLPCFFLNAEIDKFLGYVSPNHHIDGALSLMVTNDMLVSSETTIGTTKYYLNDFEMKLLNRIPIIIVVNGATFYGIHLGGGMPPPKWDLAPAPVFLPSENTRKFFCMGHTYADISQ